MSVIGFLIYYMNQCDATMSDHNVKTVTAQLEVAASYVSSKPDFQVILGVLPTDAIQNVARKAS